MRFLAAGVVGCTAVFFILCLVPGFWSWLTTPDDAPGFFTVYPNAGGLLIIFVVVVLVIANSWWAWRARRGR